MRGVPPRDRYGRPLPRGSRDELDHDGEPEEVVGSAQEACRRGIALFDERRFFEAHEFFEYAWKADDVDDRDRRFWKGVSRSPSAAAMLSVETAAARWRSWSAPPAIYGATLRPTGASTRRR